MKKKCKIYLKEIRQLRHYVVKHTTFTSSDVRKFSYSRLSYVANRIFDFRAEKMAFFEDFCKHDIIIY